MLMIYRSYYIFIVLGIVTNLIPGLLEAQSYINLNSTISSIFNIKFIKTYNSIYGLGTFAKITSLNVVSSVIIFGLIIR